MYFNGPIETLEVSLLDFSAATVTRKDLNLPVRRFDRHTTAKTIQPLTLPVVVYDDQAADLAQGRDAGRGTTEKERQHQSVGRRPERRAHRVRSPQKLQ